MRGDKFEKVSWKTLNVDVTMLNYPSVCFWSIGVVFDLLFSLLSFITICLHCSTSMILISLFI